MSIYDAVNRRNKGGTGTTSGSSSLSKKISEANKQKKERERVRDASSFDLGSFGSDLASTSKSLYDYSSTWHSPEDMANAKQGFENMYNRIGSYIDYTKKYGINNSQEFDFEGLRDVYGSVLSGWDDLTFDYGNYKNADEFNKAMTESAERDEYLSTVDVSELQAQLDDVNKQKKNAKTQLSSADYNFKKLDSGRNKPKYGVSPEAHNEAKTAYDSAKNAYFGLEENASNLQRDITLATRAQSLNALTAEAQKARGYDPEAGTAIAQGKMLADKATKETSETWNPGTNSSMASYTDNAKDTKQLIEFGTDAEKEAYYYFLGTGQTDKAKEYRDGLKESLNARKGRAWRKEADSYFEKLGVGAQAGLEQFVSGIEGALNFSGRYIPTKPSQYAAQEIRQELTQDANYLGRLGFDVVNTGANMLPSIAASAITGNPTIGAVTLGTSAGGNSYQEMINQGYSQGQAYTYGILTGVSEAALQKVMGGIGALGGTSSKIATAVGSLKNGVAKFALRWGGSMASEGLEEAAQEILTPIFKSIATGEDVESVDWGEVAYSALLGGIMGGVEGGHIAADVASESMLGKSFKGAGGAEALFNAASLSPEASEAYEAYTRYANKGITAENASNAQIGNLYNLTNAEAVSGMNKAYTDMTKQKGIIEKQRGIRDSETASEAKKARASEKLDTAIPQYTDAQTRIGKYGESLSKLGEINRATAIKIWEEEQKKKNPKAKEIKKLSSGVETSVLAKTDKAVEIKGLKDTNTLITSEGEVAIKDIKLSDKDAEVIAYAKDIASENPSMASLFVEQYDGNSDIEKYAIDFNLVTDYATNKGFTEDYALEHKGSLSGAQVSAIYQSTIIAESQKRKAENDRLIETTANGTAYTGFINDSKVDYKKLNSRQKAAVEFLKLFAKKTGMNLEFTADGGKYNGAFSATKNTLYVDVYAGIDIQSGHLEDTIIPTASHEVTHWMEQKAPELYEKLKNKVFEALKEADPNYDQAVAIDEEIKHLDESDKKKKHTGEDAVHEIVARACEDMLSRSKVGQEIIDSMTEEEAKTFFGQLKKIIKNIKKWISELLNSYGTQTDEAKLLREYDKALDGVLDSISAIWDETLSRSIEVNQALEKANTFGHLENGISEDGTTIVGENNLQMSEKTYYDGGRDFLVKWLSKRKDLTKADKEDIVNQTDRIASLMRAIAEGNDLPDYSRWADMEVVKTEDGEAVSVIVSNGDYKLNIDFSQVCKKRVALDAILNAMVTSGDLNTYVLTETDIAELNDIIKKHDFEIACALCFVDAKRYRVGAWADSFCEGAEGKEDGNSFHKYGFNEMVRSLIPKGSKLQVDEFNFTNRDIKDQPTKNLLSKAKDSELDFSLIDKIMADNDVRSAQHRYARAIKENPEIRKILNSAEIISSIGLDNIRVKAPALYKLINGHQGTAKPKFAHSGVAYGNNILQARGFTAKTAKMVGGVRCQSFSDFMANMVVDYAQFISELAAKKLTAHSYTKEPLFVKLFGLTGMKINMSLVPKAIDMTPEQQKYFAILKDKNADKKSKEYKEKLAEYEKLSENAGLDENGNYIWEDETFPYDIAMDLVVDRRYSKNCGTIAVGISKKHIRKLLADERISMVIPYHKSSLNHEVAMMRDIALYNDYTDVQNTRDKATGKKLDKDKGQKDFDFYGDLYGIGGKKGTHDPKQTAQNYLEWCEEHNYIPKFDDFADDPNYYKLLIDFRVYDVDGTYTEQQPVKTIYPPNEEFSDLILNGVKDKNGKVYGGLKQQQETSDRLDAESQQIVDEFKQRLAEKYGEDVQFSEKSVEEISKEDYKAMQNHFGTTGNFNVAGYMLADGKLLDFSGKHWGDTTSRIRQVDHRDIQEVLADDDNGVQSMVRMISNGNIRIMPETGGINLAVAPSKNQRIVLRRYIEYMSPKEGIMVDIDAVGGDTIKSFEYDKGVSADRVMRDIDNYFKGGTTSDLMQFHMMGDDVQFSMKNENLNTDSRIPFVILKNYINVAKKDYVALGNLESKVKNLNRGTYKNDATGYQADINGDTIRKALNPTHEKFDSFKASHIRNLNAILKLPELFKKAVYVDSMSPQKTKKQNPSFKEFHHFVAPIFMDNGEYRALITAREKVNSNTLYVLKVEVLPMQKRHTPSAAQQNTVGSQLLSVPLDISIADLVNGVKIYDYDLQKFNTYTDADIQFSEKMQDDLFDLFDESDRRKADKAEILEDLKRFEEYIKLEKKYAHSKHIDPKTLNMVTKWLREKADTKYATDDVKADLADIYNYVMSDDVTTEGILERVNDLAYRLVSNRAEKKVVNDDAKALLSRLRKTRISLDEAQRAEIENFLGSNWQKRFFGKIIVADDGLPLDIQWQEWANTIPGNIFDAKVNSANQMVELFHIIEDLQEASVKIEQHDTAEEVEYLASEIYNQLWRLTAYETTTEKYEQKIKELKFKHRQMMEKKRKNYQEKVDKAKLLDQMYYGRLIHNLRTRKENEVAYAKELGKQKLEEHKERIEKKTRIQRITANALTLNEYLVKNSKDKHINEDLKGPVIQLLTAIDFSSKRMLEGGEPTKQDERLSKALSKVKEMFADASNGKEGLNDLYGHGLDEDIKKMIESVERIVDSLGGKDLTLNMMTLEDLQTLDKIMRTVKAAVNNVNKFHVAKHAEGIANLSRATMGYLNELGQTILHKGLRGKLDKLLTWNNALPYYVFKRYGVGGRVIFRALMDGQDKLAFNVKQIIDYAESTYTKDEIKKWDEEVKTFNIPVPKKKADSETEEQKTDDSAIEYQTIQMTVPQIMSLYCLTKREQARKHLFAGGIRVADFETKKGGIVSQTGNVIFTEEGVAQILDSLTERQKEVADKLQEFLNTVCPEWGNEVSMARFGYKAFGEKNYFPIYSDKNNLAVDDESDKINSLFRLLNMSFTKPTDDNANNTIIVSNIFDVFAQHTSDMAKYNALALPVLDTFKWYNYNEKEEIVDGKHKAHSVKQSIETAFGKDGQSYLMTFLRDINGQQESDRESISKEFMRNFKIASVGMNLRVAALQPTSYLRAGAVIDNKYLVKAFAFKDKARGRAIDMAKKYCGIALWKSMGYYDTNIQRGVESQIKHDETWKDKVVEKSMYLAQKADEMTWGVLWNACELEIRDKRKDLEVGSEEFYETIGKRLREVIYATQVVDSVMTRSQMMRSTKGLDQFFTNFASEPTLGYNMLYDAYISMALETRRTGSKKKAWEKYGKKIQRLAVSYTLTCTVTAAIEVAFDAFRNDDDEEKNLLLAWLTNFLSNMSVTSKIPYIKELHSVIKGYRTSRSELAWAEDAWNAGNRIAKLVQGEGDFEKTLRACLKALSELTGLPGFSAYRDGYALIETIGDFIE